MTFRSAGTGLQSGACATKHGTFCAVACRITAPPCRKDNEMDATHYIIGKDNGAVAQIVRK